MSEQSETRTVGWIMGGALNLSWLVVVLLLLVPLEAYWPYQTWSWGLLLGAGAGGGAVFLVVSFLRYTGLNKRIQGGADV